MESGTDHREPVSGVSWEMVDREVSKSQSDWQWGASIVAITLGLLAIMLGNALFGIVILLGTSVAALIATHPPRTIHFTLNAQGLGIDDKFYPFRSLESYSVDYTHQTHPQLIVKAKQVWIPYIIIPLPEEDADIVEELIAQRLPEEDLEIPFIHRVVEFFGF